MLSEKQCSTKKKSKAETAWLNYIKIPSKHRNKLLVIDNKNFYPDGYDPATNTIYEFYGDYWHGNLDVFNPYDLNKDMNKTFMELYNSTINREQIIKSAGYNIISIWESEWNKISGKRVKKRKRKRRR